LVRFIENWLKIGVVKRVCLPEELLDPALKHLPDTPNKQRLKSALEQLYVWVSGRGSGGIRIEFIPGIRGIGPHQYGEVTINILHPSYIFRKLHSYRHPNRLNETSLVLRLDYGDFRALLLADIEGEGLAALLDMCSGEKAEELRCHIMKVPHHGAWNAYQNVIPSLLDRADPELAILSVGSTNTHGHVKPQLFGELLRRKYDEKKRLRRFICTEVTRTCKLPAMERRGRDGLNTRIPCADNIVIAAEHTGSWQQHRADIHMDRIASLAYAACMGRADLDAKD